MIIVFESYTNTQTGEWHLLPPVCSPVAHRGQTAAAEVLYLQPVLCLKCSLHNLAEFLPLDAHGHKYKNSCIYSERAYMHTLAQSRLFILELLYCSVIQGFDNVFILLELWSINNAATSFLWTSINTRATEQRGDAEGLFFWMAAVRKNRFFFFTSRFSVWFEVLCVRDSQTCSIISWEPGSGPEPARCVIMPAPAVQNRCSSPALAARKSRWQVAILGKLVKTTVAPQVDAAMLGCGARRQSGKHRLNLGSAAPRAFVIWRRSSRQVAAVVDCSPCTSSS